MATLTYNVELDPGTGVNKENNRVKVTASTDATLDTGAAAMLVIDDEVVDGKLDIHRVMDALNRYLERQFTRVSDEGLPPSGSLTL